MKKNTVRPIPIDIEFPNSLDFISLTLNNKGLDVHVYDYGKIGSNPPILEIHFDYLLVHRSMDEGSYLASGCWEYDEYSGENGLIGHLENSEFMEWFHYETCGTYAKEKLYHVFISTVNDCVDVITGQFPTFRWIDNPSKE